MATEPPRRFGELLRESRLQAGLTQEALAEQAGLSVEAVRALERGRRGAPRLDTLTRLATALGRNDLPRLAVAARDAPPSSPPQPRRHNLPAALSSFIGREDAQARVRELLAAGRLVTLTGAGGVGKTRLALAVATAVLGEYRDGVWLVEFASLADPALAPAALAAVLGVREEANRPLLATLGDFLRDRQVLMVLDNCEHLLAACAALALALLRAAPGLRILTTSREGLEVAGERRYPVPPLSMPDPHQLPSLELLGDYDAVRLFVERAQEREEDFSLTPATARAIVDVCVRLDGVPLALELAASWVGTIPVEAIAARLDDRFRLLTRGGQDLPVRQRSLRAALDWSWALLEAQDRTLLARLSVFAGGWTLAAAETVCAADGLESWAILDGLHSLLGKSLLQMDETREATGRYRLLETVREYAAERLADAGETEATRDRHLSWYLALAEEAETELGRSDQAVWLGRLEVEHDNLRTALSWARAREAREAGLRLADALARFWQIRGYLREGRGWLEAMLAAGTTAAPGLRARVLWGVGLLAATQSEYGRAETVHAEALALYRELQDRRGIAQALDGLATVAYWRTNYARAAALCEEVLALQRELGDKQGLARVLKDLGWCLIALQGDPARIMALGEEALALFREVGDRWGSGEALFLLGNAADFQGDYVRAATLHREGLALRRDVGDMAGTAASLNRLALALYKQGEYGRAMTLLKEGLLLSRDIGYKQLQVIGVEFTAWLSVACEQHRQAALLAGAADAVREASGAPLQPYLQVDHDRAVAAMRALLGEEAFATAWAAGRALSLDEATTLALEGQTATG